MRTYRRRAPAKVNLALEVVGLREDGYHELRTLFDALEFGDELSFLPAEGGEFTLSLEGSERPSGLPLDEGNLVLRAARAYRKAFPGTLGGRFVLQKRIPLGAGLGGGSSDGAQALKLLEEAELGEGHLDRGRDPRRMTELAASLGADLPFFLEGRRAYAAGRGDRIVPLENSVRLYYLLLIPSVHCDTAAVFRRYHGIHGGLTKKAAPLGSCKERRKRPPVSKADHFGSSQAVAEVFSKEFPEHSIPLTNSRRCPFLHSLEVAKAYFDWVLHFDAEAGSLPWLFNDLRSAAIQEYPRLRAIPRWLAGLGLPVPQFSGSGSTFFLAFKDEEACEGMAERLRAGLEASLPAEKKSISIVTTRSLLRSP